MDLKITHLAAARKMDRDALTETFEHFAPALYKFAFRLCNNAVIADQIVGDVFAKFIEQLSAGRIPGINPRFHLYEITYHLLFREARYPRYFMSADSVVREYARHRPKDVGIGEQRLFDATLRALMDDLTDDQRHVIILRFMEGFSLKETAAITGKKVNHVKVIQNRGITALRKALDYQAVETNTIAILLRRLA